MGPTAVGYVRVGLALIAIPLGKKKPVTTDWQLRGNCITTETVARRINGGNIGLAHAYSTPITGALDIDDYEKALPWLAARAIDLVALLTSDDAVQITSGRPNRAKLLYRLPHVLRTIKLEEDGLEFRCGNSRGTTVQDVLPPSIHPDTKRPYQWAGRGDWRSIPDMPPALLSIWHSLTSRTATPPSPGTRTEGRMIPTKSRNDTLTRLAGSMRAKGMSPESIEAALLAENAARCDPPLPEHEVRATAASVAKYPAGSARASADKPRPPIVWLDDAAVDFAINDLIKRLIGRKTFIVIYGPAGQGKTFFTIDAGAHIAAGQAWRGRRVKQALVVYVAAEAGVSITKRFVAWRERHLSEAREGRTPLAILTRGVNLLDLTDVDGLMAQLRELIAAAGLPLGVVIFDTLSRSTPGSEEGSADFGLAIAAADRLRDELGAATVFVHHSGKNADAGARGHSSLVAAADTVIRVEGTVNGIVSGCVAEVEKVRDGTSGEQFPFRLEVVPMGPDEDGDEVTTCVVVPTEAGTAKPKVVNLSGVARVALQALREAVDAADRVMAGSSTIPKGVRAVEITAWRDRFLIRYGIDGKEKRDLETVRKAFTRGREALLKAAAIGISNPYAWVIE
jgi:KaiC/GvpD/RAD55 family RecA-like ATPase